MTYRTLHENISTTSGSGSSIDRVGRPVVLSSLWSATLLSMLFRDVHETLRPGFVDELAHDGTVYGTEITDTTLVVSGIGLLALCSTVVLARVLPRRSNRRVNLGAAALLTAGTLFSWPKDPDDLVFGAAQLGAAALVVAICARWREDD